MRFDGAPSETYGSIDGCRLALDNILPRSLGGDTRLQRYFALRKFLNIFIYRDSRRSADRNLSGNLPVVCNVSRVENNLSFIYAVIKIAPDKQSES